MGQYIHLQRFANNITIIMWFPRIAEELLVGLISPFEDSPFVLSPHTPDWVILLSEVIFFATQGRFLRLEFSRGTEIGQAVVDLKLEVK